VEDLVKFPLYCLLLYLYMPRPTYEVHEIKVAREGISRGEGGLAVANTPPTSA
jgi:hypothetical protein